jgi:hypothetical protein|tara:strand:- start:293 stop:421 length:129 start_codon:yes stop_codon:yes gene_type:complete
MTSNLPGNLPNNLPNTMAKPAAVCTVSLVDAAGGSTVCSEAT